MGRLNTSPFLEKKTPMNKALSIFLLCFSFIFCSHTSANESSLFCQIDTDNNDEISQKEFKNFVQKIAEEQIQSSKIFGDVPLNSPSIRLYTEEMILILTAQYQEIFNLQDKNKDYKISKNEYDEKLFAPLLSLKE